MLETILTIVVFIVIFSILVLAHEFGHFFTAKKTGIKVEEFGMGLPPRAITLHTDKDGTIYSLNWIPFGGFVRMLGEDDKEGATKKDPRSFSNMPLWKRMLSVSAGVIMNFLLAIVALTIAFTAGFYPLAIVEDTKVPINSYLIQRESFAKKNGTLVVEATTGISIQDVELESLAMNAGLIKGDVILKIDDTPMDNTLSVINYVKTHGGKQIVMTVQRGEKMITVPLTPEEGKSIGVYLASNAQVNMVQFSFPESFLKASEEVARQSYITIILAKNVVTDLVQKFSVPKGVAGPVGIAQMTNTFVKLGFIPVLIFLALLSISLGVLNIMPFPALDGGRLLFMVYELITRRKPNAKVEAMLHSVGYILLLILIFVVTGSDILRLFGQ